MYSKACKTNAFQPMSSLEQAHGFRQTRQEESV